MKLFRTKQDEKVRIQKIILSYVRKIQRKELNCSLNEVFGEEKADCTEVNLTGKDLSHADFSASIFKGAIFVGSTFFNVELNETDLTEAEITNARQLNSLKLSKAIIEGIVINYQKEKRGNEKILNIAKRIQKLEKQKKDMKKKLALQVQTSEELAKENEELRIRLAHCEELKQRNNAETKKLQEQKSALKNFVSSRKRSQDLGTGFILKTLQDNSSGVTSSSKDETELPITTSDQTQTSTSKEMIIQGNASVSFEQGQAAIKISGPAEAVADFVSKPLGSHWEGLMSSAISRNSSEKNVPAQTQDKSNISGHAKVTDKREETKILISLQGSKDQRENGNSNARGLKN